MNWKNEVGYEDNYREYKRDRHDVILTKVQESILSVGRPD